MGSGLWRIAVVVLLPLLVEFRTFANNNFCLGNVRVTFHPRSDLALEKLILLGLARCYSWAHAPTNLESEGGTKSQFLHR